MTAAAIKVEHLAKKFRIGQANYSSSLRETIGGMFALRRGARRPEEWYWALRDVSFEVAPGEVLGIVGSNGAGKSTLLKIMSRIIEPSAGRIEVHGRVGSLLAVGTGFHPELTGRENIFLNGSILGMSRRETTSKLDEIIAFSGIERFLDMPVKRYSYGMWLRLGFAVAAHIDPDILIVDEVLAVGDASFQAKCIGKVNELVAEGRTVLVVSHQLPIIQKLCTRAVLIREGIVAADGSVEHVIGDHLRTLEIQAQAPIAERTARSGNGERRVVGLEIDGLHGHVLVAGEPADFRFHVSGTPGGSTCAFSIYDELGEGVTSFDSANTARDEEPVSSDRGLFRCTLPVLPLRPGRYRLDVALHSLADHVEDKVEGAAYFEVLPGLLDGRAIETETGYGSVAMAHRWSYT